MIDIADERVKWILEQHKSTNHLYDGYLPYEFHLRTVVANYLKYGGKFSDREDIELACWGHDLIEDTRVTFNDVKEVLGADAASIIYAVTNEKGKNRKERANEKYYYGIRACSGAPMVKICDRIANVEYSKQVGSGMFEMYRKENDEFMKQVLPPALLKFYTEPLAKLKSLFDHE